VSTLQIKKGTWRIAILIPKLNIAIKLPRVYLRGGLKQILYKIKFGSKSGRWRNFYQINYNKRLAKTGCFFITDIDKIQ